MSAIKQISGYDTNIRIVCKEIKQKLGQLINTTSAKFIFLLWVRDLLFIIYTLSKAF